MKRFIKNNLVFLIVMLLALAVVAVLMRKVDQPVVWAIVSGAYGLLFGALCGITDADGKTQIDMVDI